MNETKQSPYIRLWNMGKQEHSKLILAIVLAVFGVTCSMTAYFSAAQIIIALLDDNRDFSFYTCWCLIALIGYAIHIVCYNLALAKSHQATFRIMANIRQKFMHKLAKLPMGTLLDMPSGQMKQIIVDQVESMERPLAHLLPEMTSNIMAPLLIFLYLFVIDWRMALVSLISLPIGIIIMGVVMKDYGKKYEGSVKVTQDMNNTIVEYINGIEVIKTFNQGKHSYQKYQNAVMDNASYFYHWMKSCQLPISAGKTIAPATLVAVLPIGLWLTMQGSLETSQFITIMILSLAIIEPLLMASSFIDGLARIGTIVTTLESLMKSEEQHHKKTVAVFTDRQQGLVMDHVSFSYHDGEEILHDISLQIRPDTMTALVGPSGSGKSTVTKLLAGFWDIQIGSIRLYGTELKDIPLEQLNDQIAYVSQDNYLFDETIRENIRMGKQQATDEEVEAAAKASGCDAFIKTLDQGYDTMAGGSGTHLSGGERQRIAIARAMLKDAPVVILDEATAYIDPENEAVIQHAVAQLVQGKNLIIIAHRLSTITGADQIILMNKGRIEAAGTHEQLLQDSQLYQNMWNAHIGIKDGDLHA